MRFPVAMHVVVLCAPFGALIPSQFHGQVIGGGKGTFNLCQIPTVFRACTHLGGPAAIFPLPLSLCASPFGCPPHMWYLTNHHDSIHKGGCPQSIHPPIP